MNDEMSDERRKEIEENWNMKGEYWFHNAVRDCLFEIDRLKAENAYLKKALDMALQDRSDK